jgi:hypothetical protein
LSGGSTENCNGLPLKAVEDPCGLGGPRPLGVDGGQPLVLTGGAAPPHGRHARDARPHLTDGLRTQFVGPLGNPCASPGHLRLTDRFQRSALSDRGATIGRPLQIGGWRDGNPVHDQRRSPKPVASAHAPWTNTMVEVAAGIVVTAPSLRDWWLSSPPIVVCWS